MCPTKFNKQILLDDVKTNKRTFEQQQGLRSSKDILENPQHVADTGIQIRMLTKKSEVSGEETTLFINVAAFEILFKKVERKKTSLKE